MTDNKPNPAVPLASYVLPDSFYRVMADDVPVDAWLKFLQKHVRLFETLFRGFPSRPEKFSRNFRLPEVQTRLFRAMRDDPVFLGEVIELWGVARIRTMILLEILDPPYLVEQLEHLKNLIGPERYFAALFLLDRLADPEVRAAVTESYWERNLDGAALEPVLPLAEFWREVISDDPEGLKPLAAALPADTPAPVTTPAPPPVRDSDLRRQLRSAEERREAAEAKLARLKEEHRQLEEQVQRHRQENEGLRQSLSTWQEQFTERLEAELERLRRERWQLYREVDPARLETASASLESLLREADRALERQRRADAEYGTIAAVRRQLLQVTLYLRDIERIYADSLVVHADVERVKDALLKERERLMRLPGIGRVLEQEPALNVGDHLLESLRLLDPVPANLPRMIQWRELVNHLREAGLADDVEELTAAVAHKQRQIMEALYAHFHQGWQGPLRYRPIRHLDDLVKSGASKDYDLFVDGYNILLMVEGTAGKVPKPDFVTIREQFIAAVQRNSGWFHRVVLVFDGIGESRERRGNLEIVYADRNLGNSADAIIIRALQKRASQRTLLVTADREIIDATSKNVHAVVDPYHFYSLVFDVELPLSKT